MGAMPAAASTSTAACKHKQRLLVPFRQPSETRNSSVIETRTRLSGVTARLKPGIAPRSTRPGANWTSIARPARNSITPTFQCECLRADTILPDDYVGDLARDCFLVMLAAVAFTLLDSVRFERSPRPHAGPSRRAKKRNSAATRAGSATRVRYRAMGAHFRGVCTCGGSPGALGVLPADRGVTLLSKISGLQSVSEWKRWRSIGAVLIFAVSRHCRGRIVVRDSFRPCKARGLVSPRFSGEGGPTTSSGRTAAWVRSQQRSPSPSLAADRDLVWKSKSFYRLNQVQPGS